MQSDEQDNESTTQDIRNSEAKEPSTIVAPHELHPPGSSIHPGSEHAHPRIDSTPIPQHVAVNQPNPVPQSSPVPVFKPNKPKKAKKIITVASATLLSVVILGLGGLWAYQTFFTSNLDKVFAAISATSNDDEADITIELQAVSNEAGLQELFSVGENLNSKVDIKFRDENYRADFSVESSVINIQGSVAGDNSFEELYGKLDTSPFLGDSPLSGLTAFVPQSLLEKYDDTWISFDVGELSNDEVEELTEEQVEEIKTILMTVRDSGFVSVESVDGRELNGIKSDGYKVSFNRDKAVSLVDDIAAQNLTVLEDVTDQQYENIKEELQTFADEYSENLSLTIFLNGDKLSGSAMTFSDESYQVELLATYSASGLEAVELPADAVPYSELISDIEAAFEEFDSDLNLGGGISVSQRAQDTEMRADINALHAQLEAYYVEEGYYPESPELLLGVSEDALTDPFGVKINEPGSRYEYIPICTGSECSDYDLQALLNNRTNYEKNPLNPGVQLR